MDHPSNLPSWAYESEQSKLYGIFGFFIALQTVAVALRFFSKALCKMRWGVDDILISFGWLFGVSLPIGTILDVKFGGVGLHQVYVTATDPGKFIFLKQMSIALPVIYLAAVVFPKLVLIHLYLSIFPQRTLRIICWVVVAVTLSNWVACTIVTLNICTPLSQVWDPQTWGHCLDQNAFFRWLSFPNIISDVVLLLLPIPYVLKIKASMTLRAGILFTFLLGSIGLISSIIRFVIFFGSMVDAGLSTTYVPDDFLSMLATMLIWTVIEPATYLVAACLPTYRPMIRKISRKIIGQPNITANPKMAPDTIGCKNSRHNRVDPRYDIDEIMSLEHKDSTTDSNHTFATSSGDTIKSKSLEQIDAVHSVESDSVPKRWTVAG